jgi:general stress protein 26
MMDPFAPEENWRIWLATNPSSRKVNEMRRNPRVSLFYSDVASQGYVTVYGRARLVNDPKEKAKRWKEEWKDFYPNRAKAYLLIEVVPDKMEVVIVSKNVVGTSPSWSPLTVTFPRR